MKNDKFRSQDQPVKDVGVTSGHGVAEEADVDGHVSLAQQNILKKKPWRK